MFAKNIFLNRPHLISFKGLFLSIFLSICCFLLPQNLFADDYYWVGGSGNWSELNHWATSSGGSVFHSSVPDFDDNVIFDANSLNAANNFVNIDVENAVCLNLTFSTIDQNLTFGGSTELQIYAGLTLSPLITFDFNGAIIFEAKNGSHTLITEDKTFACNIDFSGLTCNWVISGRLSCAKSVYVNTHFSTISFGETEIGGDFIFNANGLTTNLNGNTNITEDLYLLGNNLSVASNGTIQCRNTYVYDGSLSLGGSLTSSGELYLSNGSFNSNGHAISFTNCLLNDNCITNLSNSTVNVSNRFSITGTTASLTSANTSLLFSGGTNLLLSAEQVVNFALVSFSNKGTVSCTNSSIQTLSFTQDGTVNGNGNTFGTTIFLKNGKINGSNQYTNLNLTAGYEYQLQESSTQTIANNFNATGNCQAHIILKSGLEGVQANISKSTGSSNVNYAVLQDINFTGGATFLSTSYVNIKNTTGLSGTPQTERTLYWIGGNGNWSDASNWSTASGGAGGECIPSPADHVVFDANSFSATNQEVLINAEQVFCNTIDWTAATNTPGFSNSFENAALHIFGSCRLNQNMNNNFDGQILFRSENAGNEIESNNNQFNADIYFEGEVGEWAQIDDLLVSGKSIHLNKGTFVSNGQEISVKDFFSNKVNYNRSLNIQNSNIKIEDSWNVVNELFTLNATSSHIDMEKENAQMQAGENLIYHNISFISTNSIIAAINGSELTINQLFFAGEGSFNCSESTLQSIVFDGAGTINEADNLFENAEFNANGFFLFNNAFDVLSLASGNTYTFKNGVTQTINTSLTTNGNCNAPITLLSDLEGSVSYIQKLNTDLLVDYIIMKDIEAVAGVNYTANNTTDLGNNPGWTINAVASKDYYWIGGTGDWEDVNHWSFTSGGIGGTVGACLPSQNDNVFFDAQSFSANGQTVSANIEKVTCKNMDWSQIDDQVIFENTVNSEFDIYGSMILSSSLNWNFSGNIFFKGTNDNFQVNTAGNTLTKNATFTGENTQWELLDNLNINEILELKQGEIIGNNLSISAKSFISNTATLSSLMASNSTITLLQSWNTAQDFQFQATNTKLSLPNNYSTFKNTSLNTINFHEIEMDGTNTTFLSNNSKITKLSAYRGSVSGTTTTIDTLHFESNAQINGDVAIEYGVLNGETQIYKNHQFGQMLFHGYTTIYMDNVFETANFYHDANIYSNNTFDTLVFSPDHSYTLASYRTQAVNNFISLKGNSCFKIIIQSGSSGSTSTISLPTGIVEGYALSLHDIQATGGADFYAAGPSVNLGGSAGWTFGSPPGYIYGFTLDSIYLAGETATLSTNTFNTDANTQFNWSTGSTQPSISTTVPGKYTVEVVYNSNPKQCSFTDEINIHFATVKNADCGNNGEIHIASDPGESYSYLWSNGNANASATALAAGEYHVEITNNNSGEKAQRTFTLTGPPQLEGDIVINNRTSCIGTNDGELSIYIAGGTPPYSYTWMDDNSITSLTRNNLAAGSYQIEISDDNNCQNISVEVEVSEPEIMSMNIAGLSNISCFDANDASLSYTANGGTPPYSCEWNNGASSDALHNLSPGEYSIIVTDANECELLYDTIFIEQPIELKADYTIKNPEYWDSNDGSIEIEPSGGTSPYSYYFTNIDGERINKTNALGSGDYILYLSDENQCLLIDTLSLGADYEVKLIIPNTFTPNNDNKNDVFLVKSLSPLSYYSISIRSRWGQKLFESNDIYNSWDGKYKGRVCSPGVYYYQIQYQSRDKIETRNGFLHLFN